MAYKYIVYTRFILAAHVFISKHDGNIPELGLGNTGACRTQVPCGARLVWAAYWTTYTAAYENAN